MIHGVHLADNRPVSVLLTQGKFSIAAPVLTASSLEVEARIPLEAPLGTAALTLRSGSESSAPFVVRIVPAAIGIYTRNGLGWGPGSIRNLGESEGDNTPERPAHPQDRIAIRVTGSGKDALGRVMIGGS